MCATPNNKKYVSDEKVYEEMSRLNNQLADMHRELSKKNAALEGLKAKLEERVKARTADLTREILKHQQTEKKLRKALKDIEQLKEQIADVPEPAPTPEPEVEDTTAEEIIADQQDAQSETSAPVAENVEAEHNAGTEVLTTLLKKAIKEQRL